MGGLIIAVVVAVASRDKKLYFGDLLLQTAVLERTPGLTLDVPASVENAIAVALYRKYELPERQTDGFNDPDRLHVYETSSPREIDFICGLRRGAELVEVKFQRSAKLSDAQTMRKAFPKRVGIVASIDDLQFEESFAVIPAALLLWALD